MQIDFRKYKCIAFSVGLVVVFFLVGLARRIALMLLCVLLFFVFFGVECFAASLTCVNSQNYYPSYAYSNYSDSGWTDYGKGPYLHTDDCASEFAGPYFNCNDNNLYLSWSTYRAIPLLVTASSCRGNTVGWTGCWYYNSYPPPSSGYMVEELVGIVHYPNEYYPVESVCIYQYAMYPSGSPAPNTGCMSGGKFPSTCTDPNSLFCSRDIGSESCLCKPHPGVSCGSDPCLTGGGDFNGCFCGCPSGSSKGSDGHCHHSDGSLCASSSCPSSCVSTFSCPGGYVLEFGHCKKYGQVENGRVYQENGSGWKVDSVKESGWVGYEKPLN